VKIKIGVSVVGKTNDHFVVLPRNDIKIREIRGKKL
jgi:hypothetical protein